MGYVTLGGQNIYIGAALGPQAAAPMTIIDNNTRPGVLNFSTSAYYVVENVTNAVITITRTGGSDGIVQVSYVTTNGTAASPTDYTAVTGTLTFLGGVTTKTFTVPIVNGTRFAML